MRLRPVVAVTGGARGIGFAIATLFARTGARVAVGDLDPELVAGEPGVIGIRVDVRDDASFMDFLDQVEVRLGPLDVLVNNAGVVAEGTFLGTSAGEHLLQLAVNLGGVERGMRLALPGMLERGSGHVVNIASAAGRIPSPRAAVYSATKHAVLALTDAVRSELLGTGVYLTSILPTAVRTEMAAGLTLRWLPQVPPDAVARAVLRAVSRRRPPATVMIPRWLRPVAALDALAPQVVRDLVRRVATVSPPFETSTRAGYLHRVARQIDDT